MQRKTEHLIKQELTNVSIKSPSSVTETNVQQKLHLQRNRLQRFHNNALPHSYVVTTTLGPVRVETINMNQHRLQ